ncbi:hypothetical protein K438DRAFT_1969269 [Mycena galopus ATCC 62051]|nr:hypothetical protein K438DRAFT_1969269 [Mycena galopus ATCC 62051]
MRRARAIISGAVNYRLTPTSASSASAACPHRHHRNCCHHPIQGYVAGTQHLSNDTNTVLTDYTININAYPFPVAHKVLAKHNNTLLDSGTTLNILPDDVAKAYNAKLIPPAKYQEGRYVVNCNAKAPPFSVRVGEKKFPIDGRDQIVKNIDSKGKMSCTSGTQAGGNGSDPNTVHPVRPLSSNSFSFMCTDHSPFSLLSGEFFLHNVVSTFNIRTNQITLTKRKKY